MLEAIFYGTFLGEDRLSPQRAAYLLLLWVLVPLGLVCLLINMMVGTIFMLGLSQFTSVADVDFRAPFFTWTGDIGVNDLRIDPHDDEGGLQPLQARRVLVDMPSWGVLMQIAGAFDRGENSEEQQARESLAFIEKIDHVGVAVTGLRADFDDGLPEALQNFGLASAAPFEAEGCVGDDYWGASELEVMGLPDRGVDLSVRLSTHPDEDEIHVDGRLDAPGSSHVAFSQHYKARSLAAFLDSEDEDRISRYERIEVRDEGFVHARDAYCAKRDGVSAAEFTERHVAAIQRRLQALGLHAGADVERAYRAYLAKGTLVIEAEPSGTIRRADYHHYAVADQQRLYNATIAAGGGAPIPLRLEEAKVRSMPASFGGSTWDLVALEQSDPDRVDTAGPGRAVSLSGRTSLFAPPPPKPVAATPIAASEPDKTAPLGYEDLASRIGDRMLIVTIYGHKRLGRIESFGRKEIQLRISVGGGYAIQHIERGQIRSILPLD